MLQLAGLVQSCTSTAGACAPRDWGLQRRNWRPGLGVWARQWQNCDVRLALRGGNIGAPVLLRA